MLREYVQDQLGASHHPAAQRLLEITLLTGGKLMVDEQQIGSKRRQTVTEFNELSLTYIRSPMRLRAACRDCFDHLHARRAGEIHALVWRVGYRKTPHVTLEVDLKKYGPATRFWAFKKQ